MSRPKQSETAILEKWRQGLFNASNRPEITTLLADFGYPLPKLKEGSDLMSRTDSIWKQSTVEGDEATAAYAAFDRAYLPVKEEYLDLRAKAKVVFRKEPELLSQLMLAGTTPESYVKLIVMMNKFCDELTANPALCSRLAMLKVTPQSLMEMKAKLNQIQELRYKWNGERGESENATEAKDTAMVAMDDWMDDFYAMAKLALADHPQYLEALGIVVKR